jgi:hypothetical protein
MKHLNRALRWAPALLIIVPSLARSASIQPRSLELDARFAFQHAGISVDTAAGDEDFGYTVFDLNGGVGYFIDSRFEIIGGLIVNHTSLDDIDDTAFGLSASGYYHFTVTGSVIPFAGLGLGFIAHGGDGPDETEFVFPEITGGVRLPFEDVVSMNFFAGYRHRFSAFGIEDAGSNDFFLGFGFSVFLQGGVGE